MDASAPKDTHGTNSSNREYGTKREEKKRRIRSPTQEPWESYFNTRFSLLTDINSYKHN